MAIFGRCLDKSSKAPITSTVAMSSEMKKRISFMFAILKTRD